METFFTFLERRVDDCSSLLCIGLDVHVNDLPAPTAEAALDFCVNIIKQTGRYAAAFKPNAAFFEVFGAEGWTALRQVIEAVQEESNRQGSMIPVILDAKRGDIASTAEAYAKSAFENLKAHCITLNPYLGRDAIEPFLQYPERGVFLLCKTSNAGAGDLQDVPVLPAGSDAPIPLYRYVAQLAGQWNVNRNIGIVVGATHPQIMAEIRASVPDIWFLAPGVGAQGGELEAALKAGLRKDGKGMLINVSRSIARAAKPGTAVAELRDQILEIKAQLD
ncbi:MAG TPA: orotidine-5'-phosphate decarboxylase [Anaerolineales bacterium]|nr:orotidine-5'-phosphate decarboxylase [Anaerolineales bacterium]